MIRLLSIVAFFVINFNPCLILAEKLNLTVNAESAILMNADTGAILYEKNAYTPRYPASTVKIATALYALQKVPDKMDVMITADQECIGTVSEEAFRKSNYTIPAYTLIPDGSHIGIKRGEQLSLKDLFFGMMIASGDDAANVIAKYVGGTIPQFMQELNSFVKQLGCKQTTLYNPHGLHHPDQKTTAYDLALLTREALKNPLFREMVSTVRYTRPKTNKQEASTLVQTNRLLRTGPYYYPKAIGVKTGYYSLAGSNLVAAAKDGDRTLIAVLLKVQERKDTLIGAKTMFEAAFNQPKVQRVLLHRGPQKFTLELDGSDKHLTTFINEDVTLEYYPAEEPKVKCLLYWQKDLKLPIAQNQYVADLVIHTEGTESHRTIKVYAQEEIQNTWMSWFKNLFSLQRQGSILFKILGIGTLFFFVGCIVFQLQRRYK